MGVGEGHACPTSLVQQQVLGLQVAVGDADAVQVHLGMRGRVRAGIATGTSGIATASAAGDGSLTTPAMSCWKNRCASGSGIPTSGSARGEEEEEEGEEQRSGVWG